MPITIGIHHLPRGSDGGSVAQSVGVYSPERGGRTSARPDHGASAAAQPGSRPTGGMIEVASLGGTRGVTAVGSSGRGTRSVGPAPPAFSGRSNTHASPDRGPSSG